MLVFLQVIDFVIVAINYCNLFRYLLDSLGPKVINIDVNLSQNHVQPLLECAAAEFIQFGVGFIDDFFNVNLHECVLRVVLDFVDDVRAVRVVLLPLVFFDSQVVVELRSVRECAYSGDVFMSMVQDFADFFTEFLAAGLEHDRAFIFIKVSFNFENWLFDLLACGSFFLVVLSFELFRRELEVFPHLIHDVEC